ncbi:GPO family capsid scaffolding protein [Caulobacter segnis]|uniref:Phage capsid protein n=1 Tax=Caulobacter segnis TaxID=88688 RepID=A0A2W5VK96_9CAUL|nr:GPO family capsid scaffolding protein [Caulobacter segnis]PZR37166.1 MAG: phage capsid protein [Caulobacter segnis]
MAAKSKFFRVAVEGATATDGRKIEASWIKDIVQTYNPETYGARVNLEHIRGYTPTSDFKAYGDVLAVKMDTVQLSIGGKTEKRLALYAQLDPTDDLVAMTKAKQKVYTSIEVAPNFGDTGKAGLVGLAVTDSPASLGTEMLVFSASNDPHAAAIKAMFDSRKQNAANVFSAAEETTIEFEDEAAGDDAEGKVMKVFAAIGEKILASIGGKPAVPAAPANQPAAGEFDPADFSRSVTEGLAEIGQEFAKQSKAITDQFAALQADFTKLKGDLEQQPRNGFRERAPATGGDGRVRADC